MNAKNVLKNFIVLSFVFLAAVSTPAFAKLKIVTTLASFADIAENVGGEEVSVTSLTKGTQDPHFVDAKPDLILHLNRADLLIHAGLGLEDGWLPTLVTGSRNGKIQKGSSGNLEASTLMALREVPKGALDRSQGDVHPGGNPHFMLDPRNGIVLAKGIAEQLAKIEPSKSAYFSQRAQQYVKTLEAKIQEWKQALKHLEKRPVVTYHKSWVYFAAWSGLDVVAYVEPKPGIPPSPEHVVKLIRLMKEKQIQEILMEPFYPKGVAESVVRETSAKLLVLPTEVQGAPGLKSYLALFDYLVEQLKDGRK